MKTGEGRAAKRERPGRIVRLALVLLACSSAAWAGSTPAGQPLSSDVAALEVKIGKKAALGDLIAIAYQSNPMIRAAKAEWEERRGEVPRRHRPGPTPS